MPAFQLPPLLQEGQGQEGKVDGQEPATGPLFGPAAIGPAPQSQGADVAVAEAEAEGNAEAEEEAAAAADGDGDGDEEEEGGGRKRKRRGSGGGEEGGPPKALKVEGTAEKGR